VLQLPACSRDTWADSSIDRASSLGGKLTSGRGSGHTFCPLPFVDLRVAVGASSVETYGTSPVTCCTGSDVDDVRGASAGRVSGAGSEKGFDIGDTVEVSVFAPNFGVSATVGDLSAAIICSIDDMLTGRIIYSPDTALALSPFRIKRFDFKGYD
jgi:hypothetical protein